MLVTQNLILFCFGATASSAHSLLLVLHSIICAGIRGTYVMLRIKTVADIFMACSIPTVLSL